MELRGEFDRIAQMYSGRLYSHAAMIVGNKHDAEDAAEEALYRLYCRKKPFNDDEHAKAWLIRVTVNAALKMLRRRKFTAGGDISEHEELSVDFEYPEQSEVYEAVKKLPVKYRTVILLHYYEDMSTKDISRILKIPQSTVTTRLSRGREQLRTLLKGEYDYE